MTDNFCECGEEEWVHALYDGCPPPLRYKPKKCCGETYPYRLVTRLCENNCCTVWYCGKCGRWDGMSAGPVLCGCWFDRHDSKGKAEWPMLPVKGWAEYHRRYRNRIKRKRH